MAVQSQLNNLPVVFSNYYLLHDFVSYLYCTLHIGMARGVCIIVYITFSVLIFLKYSIELIYIELRDSLRQNCEESYCVMRTAYSIRKSNCKMTSLVFVVHYLAVFLLAIQVESTVYDGDCHGPWMYQHNETSECKCGSTLNGKVQCNMNTSTLTVDTCVCMTYNPATNRTVAGYCLYSCIYNIEHPTYQLPMIRDDFNNLTCGI